LNPLKKPPVDCEGGYGPWTRCNEDLNKYRYYEHTVEAKYGGVKCSTIHGYM